MDKKGLTLSIVGLCLCWIPIAGLVLSIIGLIKSISALKEAKINNGPKGKSITGIALGGSGIGMSFISVPILVLVLFMISISLSDNILSNAREASKKQSSLYNSYQYDFDDYDYDYDFDWDY